MTSARGLSSQQPVTSPQDIQLSILNTKRLVNCPYDQFITTLWRGSESRNMKSLQG